MVAAKKVEQIIYREKLKFFFFPIILFSPFALYFLYANLNIPTNLIQVEEAKVLMAYSQVIPARASSGGSQTANIIKVQLGSGHIISVSSPSNTSIPKKGKIVLIKKYKKRFAGTAYRYSGEK